MPPNWSPLRRPAVPKAAHSQSSTLCKRIRSSAITSPSHSQAPANMAPIGQDASASQNNHNVNGSGPDPNGERRLISFAGQQDSLPPGWERSESDLGRAYYIDHNRRATTFSSASHNNIKDNVSGPDPNGERPLISFADQQGSLPAGWERRESDLGMAYYIDHNRRVTTWTRPSATDNEQDQRNAMDANTPQTESTD